MSFRRKPRSNQATSFQEEVGDGQHLQTHVPHKESEQTCQEELMMGVTCKPLAEDQCAERIPRWQGIPSSNDALRFQRLDACGRQQLFLSS